MKSFKRIICLILCLVFLLGAYPSVTVNALNENELEMDASYLSKAKCWYEASKYLNLPETQGMSRERIASEIYAHAVADNLSYRLLRERISLTAVAGNELIKLVNDRSHIVTIGGDDRARESLYDTLWNGFGTPVMSRRYIESRLDSKKVIDVSENSTENGAKIQLWEKNNTSAQIFNFYPTDDGDWYIIMKEGCDGCLDVTGGAKGDGVKVQLYEYNGTDAQKWRIEHAGWGFYYLKNKLGYYLDATGGHSSDGTQIQTYSHNKTNAQKWNIKCA